MSRKVWISCRRRCHYRPKRAPMVITKDEIVPVRSSEDIVRVRQAVRNWAIDLGFGLVDQTKLVTAGSELPRNPVTPRGGGTVPMRALNNAAHSGPQLLFEENGPGIADVEFVLQDSYTT